MLVPSSFARSSLLYVQEVGSLRSIRSHLSQRSHLDSYLFILVLSGSGKVSCGGITYDLTIPRLEAGESLKLQPDHYAPGYSKVVAISGKK